MEKYHPLAIGVILDVKSYNLSLIKKSLLNSIGGIAVGEDLFYLYDPDVFETLEKKGEKIQRIFNYKKIKTNPFRALVDTAMILGAEIDEEYRRKVVFITDKYDESNNEQIDIMLQIDESQRFNCEYHFIGIGQQGFDFSKNTDNTNIVTTELNELEIVLDDIFKEETNG